MFNSSCLVHVKRCQVGNAGLGGKPRTACVQVGDWDAVLDKCKAGRIQPSVLLYEDTQ